MKSIQVLSLLASLAMSAAAYAQALPTASRTPFQIGVAGSFVSSDYGQDFPKGVTGFADFSFTRRLALEGDVHYTSLSTPDNVGQQTYLAGPRYSIALEDRANIYVKVLGGLGRFNYKAPQYIPRTDMYGVVAGGVGIEYRASAHINVRAIDIEYQAWPGFPPHGLTPFVTSIGVAWMH